MAWINWTEDTHCLGLGNEVPHHGICDVDKPGLVRRYVSPIAVDIFRKGPGFDDGDCDIRVLGQSVGHDQTSCATADNHVVKRGFDTTRRGVKQQERQGCAQQHAGPDGAHL